MQPQQQPWLGNLCYQHPLDNAYGRYHQMLQLSFKLSVPPDFTPCLQPAISSLFFCLFRFLKLPRRKASSYSADLPYVCIHCESCWLQWQASFYCFLFLPALQSSQSWELVAKRVLSAASSPGLATAWVSDSSESLREKIRTTQMWCKVDLHHLPHLSKIHKQTLQGR